MEKNILWLVTARSGSKSIPDKNIKILGNQPLISYRIQSALTTNIVGDIWVSTDSEKYAEIAKEYGAEIPFIRPDYLSTDDASSMDVVLHAMEYASSLGKKYDFIGLLEPTSPFIRSSDLDKAIVQLNEKENASAIVATKESRPNRIFIQKEDEYLSELADNLKLYKKLGRQAFGKEITPSGGFYISKWDDFLKNKSFYTRETLSYLVDDISGLEIDEPLDWQFAEFIINTTYLK
ncbi:acylneuraminate cytidylyltransferase family protein [Flavobacterium cerinum]|uniref:Acylneuraminate cytidylyltransferase family protein n=1 Tax=Flavobacterium cerinum TaxID=2502784 RepID=A0A3S3RKW7_9FLAO|nr:acylneuraminate cytidylyltransferase family protein [Flavobacterium cerinum]RWX02383.1 acylneuraminate cytidylyltransferase family protein [Flavobacterium cerinum]